MSSQQACKDPQEARRQRLRSWALTLAAVLVVAFLWHQVFTMTGLLWWNAQAQGPSLARPAPPRLPAIDTSWVDVDAYLKTHPTWEP